MRQIKEPIDSYVYKLLKRKNYFIRELYLKLINRYDQMDVSSIIKKLINEDLLNDKLLIEMKTYFLLHIKMYGRIYIYNYFVIKGLSENLVNYVLSKYSQNIFLNNMNKIKNDLARKGRNEEYIYNFLLRRGYSDEEIKNM